MTWLGNQGDDTFGDQFMLSSSLWQRTMVGESQFYQFEALFLPKTIKELFRFAYHAYLTNDSINPALEKLAEYPITEFIFTPNIQGDPDDQEYQEELKSKERVKKSWQDLFDIQLQAKLFAIQISLDFYVYGNAFLSVYQPFDRVLVCGNRDCRHKELAEKASYSWDRSKLQFVLKCRKCGHRGIAKVIDQLVKDPSRIHLIRWYPGNIDIDFNPYSGNKEFYYNIPDSEVDKIRAGNPLRLHETPMAVIEAIRLCGSRKGGSPKIKLNAQNIFHLSRHSASAPGAENPWGMPILIAALRSIFYMNMMRRAQTALMMDHILPFRWLYPAGDSTANTSMAVNLGDWRARMWKELRRWKRDPLYIMLAPIPVAQGQMGGQGKALMLFPEMDQVRKDIITSVNVPIEFVYGGLQYTGSSVSLRMLENTLMNAVEQVEKAFRWIARRVHQITGLELVEVSLKRFKMADDVQQKSLLANLWQIQAISGEFLGQIFDFDFNAEQKKRNAENILSAVGAAKAQAHAATKMQSLQNLLMQSLSPDQRITAPEINPQLVEQVYQGLGSMKEEDQPWAIQQIGAQNPELAQELQLRAATDTSNYGQVMSVLSAMSPQNQASFLQRMSQTNPAQALILENLAKHFDLEGLTASGGAGGPTTPEVSTPPSVQIKQLRAMPQTGAATAGMPPSPMPEQRPPRRQGGSPM